MHSAFLQGNHQNLLKLLYADSSRDMTNRRPRVRSTEWVSGLWGQAHLQPNDIVWGWHAQCMTNWCNFRAVCGPGEISLMLVVGSLQNCTEFPDLNHLGLERASLDKLQIITLHSFHCTLLFYPPYLQDLSFYEQARSASILTTTQQNTVLFWYDK